MSKVTARVAVTAMFAANGLLFGSWTAHIPQLKGHLRLSDGALGLALLGAPVGSVIALAATGFVLARFGSRTVVSVALVGYCLTGIGVGTSTSMAELFGWLALWGAFQASMDVAMNAQGVAIERAIGKPIMSGLHASWSIGALAGAGAGVIGVALGASLSIQLATLGVPTLLIIGRLSRTLLVDKAPRMKRGPHAHIPIGVVLLSLGFIAFASMLAEGAIADWSAVYLRNSLHNTNAVAGLAYAAFAFVMVTTRLFGNKLARRFAPRRLIATLAATGSIVMMLALVEGGTAAAIFGFAALAGAFALVVPTAFSAASRIPALQPGTAIAIVSAIGWIGLMAGPPLIGALATRFSLRVALVLLPALAATIGVAALASHALDPVSADSA